jgi:bla regulator protein blaR1
MNCYRHSTGILTLAILRKSTINRVFGRSELPVKVGAPGNTFRFRLSILDMVYKLTYRIRPVMRLALTFAPIFLAAGALRAQTKQEFDVATIKPTGGDDSRTLVQVLPGGGLKASGTTLKFLITQAYEVRPYQISGGSGWINTDRFDIVAKSDGSHAAENAAIKPNQLTEQQYKRMSEQMRPRLQALLADRFRLRLHRETKEEPVYELLVGKRGSTLQPSNDFKGLRIGRGQYTGAGATLEMLTIALATQLDRSVIDRTGLRGAFNFKLEWTPDGLAGGDPPTDASAGPSLFTALQEQLGLTLKSTKGPVEVLVIDSVDRPSAN